MGRLLARFAVLALAVVALNFALPRLLPGDPLDQHASEGLNTAGPPLTSAEHAHLRAYYHLDRPLGGQWLAYLDDLAHGDLGWSISHGAPVGRLIGERLPWTLALLSCALLVAGVGGSLLGLLAAWRGGRLDRVLVSACTSVGAVPEFLLGMGLLLTLAVGLGWLPLQGARDEFAASQGGVLGALNAVFDVGRHLTLPALTLVLAGLPPFVLVARGAARAVCAEPYLITARAKGLPEPAIALGHAAPNALLPVLTLLGVRVGELLGGTIVIERLFAIPGLGLFAFEAIRARDYPVLQAVFLVSSLGMLLVNLGVELTYRWLEPRRGG